MKRTLLLIIFILSFLSATDAQWYNRSCGVTDINNLTPEELECLWGSATEEIRVGAILVVIGTSSVIVGTILVIVDGGGARGTLLFLGGLTANIISIPVLLTGAKRASELEKISHYGALNSRSLNLSPVIGLNQFNGSHYLGMSLSFNF